jgi:putative tryptophan/tyrosine transport system substrate-binding protein
MGRCANSAAAPAHAAGQTALVPAYRSKWAAHATDPKAPPQWEELETAGRKLGLNVALSDARAPDDLDSALQALDRQRVEVMIVLQTSMLLSERRRIARLAAMARLPAIYGYREHVDDGGLISYGVDLRACFRRGGYFVHRILTGVSPSDLPVEFPTKLELVISLKTAKALGPPLVPRLSSRKTADRVSLSWSHARMPHWRSCTPRSCGAA